MSSQQDDVPAGSQPDSQLYSGKQRNLIGCTMQVLSFAKKEDKDLFMTLDIEFKFDDEPYPIRVGGLVEIIDMLNCSQIDFLELLYSPEELKRAWNKCINETGV